MDELLSFVFVILIIVGIVYGIFYGFSSLAEYSCYKHAEIYEVEATHNWSAGCFYKYQGKFIPKEEYEKLLIPNYQMGNAEVKVKIQD